MRNTKEESEKLIFETHGEEILRARGFSKSAFSEEMGIQKQNIKFLFSTKNILMLKRAAQVLDIPIDVLISKDSEVLPVSVRGVVQVEDKVFQIEGKESLQEVMSKIEEMEQVPIERRLSRHYYER